MNIKENMNKVFENLDKDFSVAILLQQSPDPDALGAALCFSTLIRIIYGLDSKIFYFGEISHPQNKVIKKVLHISLNNGEEFDSKDVSATVVLDTDLKSTGFESEELLKVDVRIDHHSMDRDVDPILKDIRNVGSTCSIVWDYFNEFGIEFKDYPAEATAIIAGIVTDTINFTSDTLSELDLKAFASVLPFANKSLLAEINKFPLPKEVFEKEAEAFQSKSVVGTTLVSNIGEISAHSRDLISTISDRFARMAGINTVVIMAVIDNHLQASIRSDDSRVDVNDLCIKVYGKEFGGSKGGVSGGARVPLESALEYIKDKDVRSQVIEQIFVTHKDRIFEALGEETEEEDLGG